MSCEMYCVLCGRFHDGKNGLDRCPKSEFDLNHLWAPVGMVKDWFKVKRVYGPDGEIREDRSSGAQETT